MLPWFTRFLHRPMAGDFSLKTQLWSSLRGGVVVLGVLLLFGGGEFQTGGVPTGLLLLLTGGIVLAAFMAGYVLPKLLSRFYDEDRWTVWKQALHVPVVLLFDSISNQLILHLTGNNAPSFGWMYWNVLLIGIFPTTLDVLLTEHRRLRRNLTHAQSLNAQLSAPVSVTPPETGSLTTDATRSAVPEKIALTSENGRDRLLLPAEQLRYVESVGNYVEVYWLNAGVMQKTVLRTTLKDVTVLLDAYPTFLRCHRAFLVNLTAVTHTEGNARGYQLTLTDVLAKIPVSRGYLDAFDTAIKDSRPASQPSQNRPE